MGQVDKIELHVDGKVISLNLEQAVAVKNKLCEILKDRTDIGYDSMPIFIEPPGDVKCQ